MIGFATNIWHIYLGRMFTGMKLFSILMTALACFSYQQFALSSATYLVCVHVSCVGCVHSVCSVYVVMIVFVVIVL